MPKKPLPFPGSIYVVLLVYLSISYTALMLHQPYLDMAIKEDNYFENASFLGLLLTAILFIYAFFKSRRPEYKPDNPPLKQLSYLALAMIFIFGAGEEISWGQRIFHTETPEVLQKENVQDEINVHNLAIFEGKNSVVTVDTLFTTFSFTLTLLVPLLASRSRKFERFVDRLMPVPHWSLGLLFLANFLLAKIAKVLFVTMYQNPAGSFTQGVQEIKEGNYGLLFVLVATNIAFVTLHRRAAAAGQPRT
jgi:hypothetical protein